jgi:hypothetical protein
MNDGNKCPEPCGGSSAVFTCPGMNNVMAAGFLMLEPPQNIQDLGYTFTWDIRIVSTDASKYSPKFEVRVPPLCTVPSMCRTAADA